MWIIQALNLGHVLIWKRLELTTLKAAKPTLSRVGGRAREFATLRVSEQELIMLKSMKNFAADEAGVTAIEYALIASLIAVFIITAIQTVGTKVSTVFTEVGNSLK
jgi:pilus assembly protein Flp/PilA